MSNLPSRPDRPQGRASLIAALVILGVCAALLPTRLPPDAPGVSSEACLALSERAPGVTNGDLRLIEQCSWRDPRNVALLEDLGDGYDRGGDAAAAEATYRRALEVDPGQADLRLRLGRLLLRRRAPDEARREAHTALRIQPNRRALIELLHESERSLNGAVR